MKMGISYLSDLGDWLIVDDDHPRDLEHKRRLYRAAPNQVWVEHPRSRPAQREVAEAIIDHLGRHTPLEQPKLGPDEPPLRQASLWVQEDLCVMERAEDTWRLTAASVCFPSRWDLPSKLGRTLTEIHDPVPGYEADLSGSADRFFDALVPARIAVRSNWSLMTTPELHQPVAATSSPDDISAEDAPRQVVLRTERQTLRRFARTGAIVFTIRTFRDPLLVLAHRPEAARALAAAVRAMPPALADYKGLPPLQRAVLACLDAWSR